MKKIFLLLIVLKSFVFATDLISEGFNGGTTAPTGWTFNGLGGTYTTNTNFGKALHH